MTSFKVGLPFAVAILIAPFSAAAQQSISPTVDGILSVSYGQSDLDGTDLEREAFMLDSTISLGNNVSIGVNADHVKNSVDEPFANYDVSLNRFQIEPTYHFGNNFYVGGFIQSASVSAITVDFDASGLFAGFDGEKWSAEAYAGRSDMNFFGGTRTTDSSLHGLSVSYSASENLEISAHVSQTNLPDIFGGGQHDLKSVAAFYKIGNGFSIHGALEKFESGMMVGRTKTRAIGVGYNFAEAGISVPGTFMLEADRSELGSFLESDTIIASWVVPFGKQTAKPLDSAARSSSGDIRTAYVSYLSNKTLLGLDLLSID
ncbi:hypothetical protein OAL88_00315 [bacterium]|nr:hypothetical protein [bacterium]